MAEVWDGGLREKGSKKGGESEWDREREAHSSPDVK